MANESQGITDQGTVYPQINHVRLLEFLDKLQETFVDMCIEVTGRGARLIV